jgi:uncharacterized membrane protein (DUF2068 family)
MMKNARKARKGKLLSGLRIVAFFEGAKGALVLLTGLGLLSLIHKDVHHAAEQLVRLLHFNPARHYPQVFLDASSNITDVQLLALATSAMFYTLVRFIEAGGLWLQRRWAEWFGLLSGGIYIPMEIYEVTVSVTWPKILLLVINTGVVSYLIYALVGSKQH